MSAPSIPGIERVLFSEEQIEERIREMPEQYLWTHRRFKTRPGAEAGFY